MDRYIITKDDVIKDLNGDWVKASDAQILLDKIQKLTYEITEIENEKRSMQYEIERLTIRNIHMESK